MKNLQLGDWNRPGTAGEPEYLIGPSDAILVEGLPYQTQQIGTLIWTTANYAGSRGHWFVDSEEFMDRGRLVDYDDCIAIELPEHWRVPTAADFENLLAVAEGSASLLKTSTLWVSGAGTNSLGFSALPSGSYNSTGAGWAGLNDLARFWTTTSDTPGFQLAAGLSAYDDALGLFEADPEALLVTYPWLMSVRFVRDAPSGPAGDPMRGYHDLLVLPSGQAETTESLAQRVDVRLRTFIGEHWLNPELGVPWFEEFLRKAPDLAVCRQILVTVLHDVPGVEEVHSLAVDFAKSSRQMRVSFVVSGSDPIPQSGLTAVPL